MLAIMSLPGLVSSGLDWTQIANSNSSLNIFGTDNCSSEREFEYDLRYLREVLLLTFLLTWLRIQEILSLKLARA